MFPNDYNENDNVGVINEEELRKKRLMAIVIMVVIMLLSLILILTSFTLDFWGTHQIGGSLTYPPTDLNGDGIPDLNIPYGKYKNGEGIFNVDTNGDGVADFNFINQDEKYRFKW